MSEQQAIADLCKAIKELDEVSASLLVNHIITQRIDPLKCLEESPRR